MRGLDSIGAFDHHKNILILSSHSRDSDYNYSLSSAASGFMHVEFVVKISGEIYACIDRLLTLNVAS